MKTVITYGMLVGLPILGVLLILRLGQNLTPPLSVGGQWSMALSPSALSLTEAGCTAAGEDFTSVTLAIAQSGPKLVLTLDTDPTTQLAGVITEVRVNANAQTSKPATGPAITQLEATVDRAAEPDQLVGALTLPGCSTPLPFTAVRQPTTLSGTVNH